MNQLIQKNLRFNYIVNLLDGAFFGFATGFVSLTTVVPLFFSNMTDSALLIGLIPAIHNVGWQLPQLLTAKRVSRMEKFKPFVLFMTTQERIPFFGFAIIALLIPKIGKDAALAVAFAMLVWQGLGAGLTANAWQNFIGKIIPGDMRATFFGLQSAVANLLASVGAILSGIIIQRAMFPYNFSITFTIGVGLMVVSWIFLSRTREPHRPIEEDAIIKGSLWSNVVVILKKDKPFRWFLVSRMVSQFGMMAFAFYTVYAVKHQGMSPEMAGVLTSVLLITSTLANPLMGWLADRWDKRRILELGALAGMLSSAIAYYAPSLGWFFPVFILMGICSTAFWTIGMAATLEFGQESERPTYVGMANTLIAPSAILAPLIGGWLADYSSYGVTFLVSTAAGLVTVLMMHFLMNDNPKQTA
jgi:MFS family permease